MTVYISLCVAEIEMEFAEFIRTAQVEAVTLYQANQLPIKGTLCVTGHHLILSSRDNHIEELWVCYFQLLNQLQSL